MNKVNVCVNVRGEVVKCDMNCPQTVEDCCKLLREDEIVRLCHNHIKRNVAIDMRKQAEYVHLMKAYDTADDTTRRGMFSNALGSDTARKTLLRTMQ